MSVFLNSVLLFLVLFYVYPLKFLFTFIFRQLMGESLMVPLADGRRVPMLTDADGYHMMVIYDGGFIGVFLLFTLLYGYALRNGQRLQLTPYERHETISRLGALLIQV